MTADRNQELCVYEIDDTLRYLKGKSNLKEWIWLALLHGVTSHYLSDPFTKLSGIEMAFFLLKYPCWPIGLTFSEQEIILLSEFVRLLVPVRKYYPAHLKRMETIIWESSRSYLVQYDGFAFLLQKIYDTHDKYNIDNKTCKEIYRQLIDVSKFPTDLYQLEYFRNRELYSDLLYIPSLDKLYNTINVNHQKLDFNKENHENENTFTVFYRI